MPSKDAPPNAGYHALYVLLRLHHPLLHSVFSTANVIPRQRRSESFSLNTRRLQDFMARERLATRTYTESEALDLAVRNLLPDWASEIRRMVERDKRNGPVGTMPFKLTMLQLATTFVEYAAEIGRDAPVTGHGHATASRHSTIRRIEASPTQISAALVSTDDALGDDEIDLIVRAISQNQASSSVCLGCQQPGHTLEQCNRFVDYIVAESLAQRHPQLKAQVALSHRQFRTRLTSAGSRDTLSTARTVRSLQMDGATIATATSSMTSPTGVVAPVDELDDAGYQQHAIHVHDGDDVDEDFEAYFSTPTVNSVSITVATDSPLPPADTVSLFDMPDATDKFLLRRLAATCDDKSASSFAHADTMGPWHARPTSWISSSRTAPSPLVPPSVSTTPVTTLSDPSASDSSASRLTIVALREGRRLYLFGHTTPPRSPESSSPTQRSPNNLAPRDITWPVFATLPGTSVFLTVCVAVRISLCSFSQRTNVAVSLSPRRYSFPHLPSDPALSQ